MAVDWRSFLIPPGGQIVLPDWWDNLNSAVVSVLGTGGIVDADVPDGANIPNSAIDKQLTYSPLIWDNEQNELIVTGFVHGITDCFPATSLRASGDRSVTAYRYYCYTNLGIAIGLDGTVVFTAALTARTYLSPATAITAFDVLDGQMLTICTYAFAAPAVGADMPPAAVVPAHIELYVSPRSAS